MDTGAEWWTPSFATMRSSIRAREGYENATVQADCRISAVVMMVNVQKATLFPLRTVPTFVPTLAGFWW